MGATIKSILPSPNEKCKVFTPLFLFMLITFLCCTSSILTQDELPCIGVQFSRRSILKISYFQLVNPFPKETESSSTILCNHRL